MRLVLVLALGCGHAAPTSTDPPPPTGDRDTCTNAAECTLVDACCGCSAGGRRVAIRKDYVDTYNASRPKRCGTTKCAQHVSTDESCSAEAVCNGLGRCAVATHAIHNTD